MLPGAPSGVVRAHCSYAGVAVITTGASGWDGVLSVTSWGPPDETTGSGCCSSSLTAAASRAAVGRGNRHAFGRQNGDVIALGQVHVLKQRHEAFLLHEQHRAEASMRT